MRRESWNIAFALAETRRQPEGNGVAERFIRTLKENLLWVQRTKDSEASMTVVQYKNNAVDHCNSASRPSRNCAWHCLSSPTATTPIGCSPVMATEHHRMQGQIKRAGMCRDVQLLAMRGWRGGDVIAAEGRYDVRQVQST